MGILSVMSRIGKSFVGSRGLRPFRIEDPDQYINKSKLYLYSSGGMRNLTLPKKKSGRRTRLF